MILQLLSPLIKYLLNLYEISILSLNLECTSNYKLKKIKVYFSADLNWSGSRYNINMK